MALQISDIRVPVEEPESALPRVLARRLELKPDELIRWRILRKSLDARSRDNLVFVYAVVVEFPDEEARLEHLVGRRGIESFQPRLFDESPPGAEVLPQRPVVVGSGPAGLLAGYYLARRGFRPLIIDRGQPVKQRVGAVRSFERGEDFQPENNYLFGEGGAGCFSDGKLTCRLSGPDVDWVLERFIECGGQDSIRYEHRPHLGSNRLPLICRNFRRRIEAMGGEYRFGCRLEGIDIAAGHVRGLMTSGGYLKTGHVVLGIGHSARDTYRMLHELGIPMQAKAFQMGLRIEHPQEEVNRYKYGRDRYLDLLGAADYTLVARGQKDLYTFCMCAGGLVIPSISEPEMFCTNGMSDSRHSTPFANSGVVVTLEPNEFASRHPLAGVALQQRYESLAFQLAGRDYSSPIQSVDDFLSQRNPDPKGSLQCSYRRGTHPLNLEQVVPPSVANAIRTGLPIMDRKWQGRFLKNATLVGPEMRGSSPVRIERDSQSRECPGCEGLYPVGEGAGYAGGIVSAAVDGLRTAKIIVQRYAPLDSSVPLFTGTETKLPTDGPC
jgi:hypothetical protein